MTNDVFMNAARPPPAPNISNNSMIDVTITIGENCKFKIDKNGKKQEFIDIHYFYDKSSTTFAVATAQQYEHNTTTTDTNESLNTTAIRPLFTITASTNQLSQKHPTNSNQHFKSNTTSLQDTDALHDIPHILISDTRVLVAPFETGIYGATTHNAFYQDNDFYVSPNNNKDTVTDLTSPMETDNHFHTTKSQPTPMSTGLSKPLKTFTLGVDTKKSTFSHRSPTASQQHASPTQTSEYKFKPIKHLVLVRGVSMKLLKNVLNQLQVPTSIQEISKFSKSYIYICITNNLVTPTNTTDTLNNNNNNITTQLTEPTTSLSKEAEKLTNFYPHSTNSAQQSPKASNLDRRSTYTSPTRPTTTPTPFTSNTSKNHSKQTPDDQETTHGNEKVIGNSIPTTVNSQTNKTDSNNPTVPAKLPDLQPLLHSSINQICTRPPNDSNHAYQVSKPTNKISDLSPEYCQIFYQALANQASEWIAIQIKNGKHTTSPIFTSPTTYQTKHQYSVLQDTEDQNSTLHIDQLSRSLVSSTVSKATQDLEIKKFNTTRSPTTTMIYQTMTNPKANIPPFFKSDKVPNQYKKQTTNNKKQLSLKTLVKQGLYQLTDHKDPTCAKNDLFPP